MWTVTAGTVSGVSSSVVNASLAIVQGAAEYWGRYVNDSLANISIRVNFVPLGNLTLAQAGTSYFFDRSAGGFDFFEALTITELKNGNDRNGSSPDITIDIDTQELLANEFHLAPLVNGLSANVPFNKFDLFTVIVHEIGHGLGILTFLDEPGNDRTDFDERVVQSGGTFTFNGPAVAALGLGPVLLDNSIAHLAESTGSLLGPRISAGERTLITSLDVAVLQDIGVPVRTTTPGADLLWGFPGDETINGGDGNDTLNAFGGTDQLFGGDGNDLLNANDSSNRLNGGAGDDTLNGSATMNDSLVGGSGADLIDGKGGFDVVDYEASASGVSINLLTGINTGGDAAGDTLLAIEQILGSLGADTLIGDAGANWFTTNGGGDYVDGGAGADTLSSNITGFIFGVDPMDTLIGGAGADRFIINSILGALVSYSTSPGSVFVDLVGGVFNLNDATGDSLANAANLEGSQFNDTLIGIGSGTFINGLGGDDSLSAGGRTLLDGGAGADTLAGSIFNDTLKGGDGSDVLVGGGGDDDFSGGNDFDFVTYAQAGAGVTVNLTNVAANAGAALGDTVRGDVEGLIGTAFNDFLQGNANANELRGGAGDDTLIGGFGDDTLLPGAGADSVNGGDGFDIVSYVDALGPVRVALWNPASNTGDAAGDIINFQVEVVLGSAFGDNLQGNTGDNNLRGGAGNDLILGGFGNDTLDGGAGADDFGGGEGVDVVSYATSVAPVRVALWNPAFHSGEAFGDNIRADIEIIEGSSLNDSLEGSAVANNFRGGAGNDGIFGGGGNDTLWGQAGNDTLTGGPGDDLFVFDVNDGLGRIADFVGGDGASDVIGIVGFGADFDTFAEVTAAATQSGADLVIDFGGGRILTLANVMLDALAADDFLFS